MFVQFLFIYVFMFVKWMESSSFKCLGRPPKVHCCQILVECLFEKLPAVCFELNNSSRKFTHFKVKPKYGHGN